MPEATNYGNSFYFENLKVLLYVEFSTKTMLGVVFPLTSRVKTMD